MATKKRPQMAESEPDDFQFQIKEFTDVQKHLRALWKKHNELAAAAEVPCDCTNPPDTCGSSGQGGRPHRAKR
jgi:hypothetical protein